jgi:universal stress protein E
MAADRAPVDPAARRSRQELDMARSLKRILVAIRDLRHVPQGELGKAAALARAAGARIELFHAIDEPDPAVSWPETATAAFVEHRRAAIADRKRHRLERFGRDESLKGLDIECTTSWDYPPHEAIIRRALASRADLVIALTRHHRLGARFVLRNTDWELIRHCPAPLLLLKSGQPYRRPPVIAAVDPFHARPADLDARLLTAGARFARLLRGSLHVFHAYMPLVSAATMPLSTAPMVMLPPEAEAAHGQQIARAIDKLADSAAIPRARRHVHMGDVSGELRAVVGDTAAGLVVMGAVSRSGLARLFIGNTAERVLDRLDCDLLIIKPRGFSAQLGRRPAAAEVRPTRRPRSVARERARAPASAVTTMRVMLPPH